jgi:hypothetical protein
MRLSLIRKPINENDEVPYDVDIQYDIRQKAREAYNKAYKIGDNPESRKIILNSGVTHLQMQYAKEILRGRWPEAEPQIIKDPDISYQYASDVMHGAWPEAEYWMLHRKEPKHGPPDLANACVYAKEIKGRWPELEKLLLLMGERDGPDPTLITWYADHVIHGRWPEAEPIILRDGSPATLNYYVNEVLKNRWPEAEPIILQDPGEATSYAINILKQRWPAYEQKYMKYRNDTPKAYDVLPDDDEFSNEGNGFIDSYREAFNI